MHFRQVKRREFITLLGGAAAAWPIAARGQQFDRLRRVGVVMGYPESGPAAQAQVAAFRQERRLDWEEGRNARIDVRYPAAGVDRVRVLVELMNLRHVLVFNTNLVYGGFSRASANHPNCFRLCRRSGWFPFC